MTTKKNIGDLLGLIGDEFAKDTERKRQEKLIADQRQFQVSRDELQEQRRLASEERRDERQFQRDVRLEGFRLGRADLQERQRQQRTRQKQDFGLLFQEAGDNPERLKKRREQIFERNPDLKPFADTLPAFSRHLDRKRTGRGGGADRLKSDLTKFQQQLDKEVRAKDTFIRNSLGLKRTDPIDAQALQDLVDPVFFPDPKRREENQKAIETFEKRIGFLSTSTDELTRRLGERQNIKAGDLKKRFEPITKFNKNPLPSNKIFPEIKSPEKSFFDTIFGVNN